MEPILWKVSINRTFACFLNFFFLLGDINWLASLVSTGYVQIYPECQADEKSSKHTSDYYVKNDEVNDKYGGYKNLKIY